MRKFCVEQLAINDRRMQLCAAGVKGGGVERVTNPRHASTNFRVVSLLLIINHVLDFLISHAPAFRSSKHPLRSWIRSSSSH